MSKVHNCTVPTVPSVPTVPTALFPLFPLLPLHSNIFWIGFAGVLRYLLSHCNVLPKSPTLYTFNCYPTNRINNSIPENYTACIINSQRKERAPWSYLHTSSCCYAFFIVSHNFFSFSEFSNLISALLPTFPSCFRLCASKLWGSLNLEEKISEILKQQIRTRCCSQNKQIKLKPVQQAKVFNKNLMLQAGQVHCI